MTDTTAARAEKIAKLMAKAQDAGVTPEEREAFAAKAAELMAQWNIEDWQVRGVDHTADEMIEARFVVGNPFATGRRHLLSRLLSDCDVFTVHWNAPANGGWVYMTYGRRGNIDRARLLWATLELEAITLAKRASRTSRPKHVNANRFISSFLLGFGVGVHRAFARAKAGARAQADERHLPVPMDDKALAESFAAQRTQWRKSRAQGPRISDMAAFHQGREAGENRRDSVAAGGRAAIGGAR